MEDVDQCPKGQQCPLGFTSRLWCDVCNAPEPQPQPVQEPPIIVGDLHPPISNATIQKDGSLTINVGGKLPPAEKFHNVLNDQPAPGAPPDLSASPKKLVRRKPKVVQGPPVAKTAREKGHVMIAHFMPARFDNICKCCGEHIAENDPLAGVRPSFYDMAPLRWVCARCGNLYELAYSQLVNNTRMADGHIITISSPDTTLYSPVILTYEWDDMEQKWTELRTTHASTHRVRTGGHNIIMHHTQP